MTKEKQKEEREELLGALREVAAIGEAGVIERRESGKPTWYVLDAIKDIANAAIANAKKGKTKGEIRAARKAAGRPWNIETSASGHPEVVRVRTPAEERRHERAMERWYDNGGGGDFDMSMNG